MKYNKYCLIVIIFVLAYMFSYSSLRVFGKLFVVQLPRFSTNGWYSNDVGAYGLMVGGQYLRSSIWIIPFRPAFVFELYVRDKSVGINL
jgi:hypothetical protein